MTKLPRYFIVNGDTYVKVDLDNDEVFALNQYGNPFSPMQALVEGVEIKRKEFDDGIAKFSQEPPNLRAIADLASP